MDAAKAEQSTEQEAAPVAVEETPVSEDAQAPAAEAEATTPKTEEAAEESPAAEAEAEAVEAPVQESASDAAAPAEADATKTEEPAAQLSTETSSVAATPAASVATPPPPASLTQENTAEIRTEESLPTPPPTPPPMIEESTTRVDWDPAFQVIPVKQEAEIAACLVEEVCVITDPDPETHGRVETPTTTTPSLIPSVDTLDAPEPETDVLAQMKDKRAEFIKNMVGSVSSADEVPIPSPESEELGTPPPLPASLPPTVDTSMNDSGLEQSLPVPEIDAETSVYVSESEPEPVLEVEIQSQTVGLIESAPAIEIEVQVPNVDLSVSVAADQSISELILAVEELTIVAEPDSTQEDSFLPPVPSLELDVSLPSPDSEPSEADCLEHEHVESCPNSDSVLEASLQVQPDSTVITQSELDDSLMPASTIDEDFESHPEHIAEAEQVEESETPEAAADEAQPEQPAEEQASQEAQQEESQAEAQESDKAPAAEEESTETQAVEE